LLGRLGRYQLITKLAVGGMAEVYLARHGELAGFRTLVVVKKVLPHLASQPEFISMFLDEARIASLLDHPNVVRIIEVGRADEEYFLAMELVQGKPLSSVIRRTMDRNEHLSPKIGAWIVAQAAAGLHHAHGLTDAEGRSLGLVHRDVSPQNILVSFEGAVKVIDFGIARALGRLTDTAVGRIKGKFAYMAPEHGTGDLVGPWTDIFALGVVLWESLCGRRLFARDNDLATMRAILEEPVPRPSTFVKIPPALEVIVMKALARDPAKRFPSAEAMAQALERFTFQAGGVSTGEVAGLMKDFFADDRAKWLTSTRLALEVEAPADATQVRAMKLSQTGIPVGSGVGGVVGATGVGRGRRVVVGAVLAVVAVVAVMALLVRGRGEGARAAGVMVRPRVVQPAEKVAEPQREAAQADAEREHVEPEPAAQRARRHPPAGHRPGTPRLDVPSDRFPNPF
jgi:hypothetical protein